MAKPGYHGITVNDKIHKLFLQYCKQHNLTADGVLIRIMDEKEETRNFAKKITKVPETVRRYT